MRLCTCRTLPLALILGCNALSPNSPVPANDEAVPIAQAAEKKIVPSEVDPKQQLKEAANRLDVGDEAGALPSLTAYVAARPEHAAMRAHLAELLFRLHQPVAAKRHLERYVADAQEQGETSDLHLIHAQTRLVEIAAGEGDVFAERLHRGIGLYLLAERECAAREVDDAFVEKTTFLAIAELKAAVAERPDEPRPHWYLFKAWSQLGQRLPAETHLRRARALALLGGLTPAETESLAGGH